MAASDIRQKTSVLGTKGHFVWGAKSSLMSRFREIYTKKYWWLFYHVCWIGISGDCFRACNTEFELTSFVI